MPGQPAKDVGEEQMAKRRVCEICHNEFTTRQALFTHKKRKHKDAEKPLPPLSCCQCKTFRCHSNKQLIAHYNSTHDKKLEIKTMEFNSEEQFEAWKKETETSCSSSFIQARAPARSQQTTTTYFTCHRSGCYRPKGNGKRALKVQGSAKIEKKCCAFMIKIKDNSSRNVKVTFCLDHLHDDTELAHLRISDQMRTNIAGKLASGATKMSILNDITENSVQLDRDSMVTRKDIENIQRQNNILEVQNHVLEQTLCGNDDSRKCEDVETLRQDVKSRAGLFMDMLDNVTSCDALQTMLEHVNSGIAVGESAQHNTEVNIKKPFETKMNVPSSISNSQNGAEDF